MRRFFLMMNRLCLSAWVGAAIFFVAVTIRPLRSPELESEIKPKLAQILFPGYYTFGFTLMAATLVCGWWARKEPSVQGTRYAWHLPVLAIGLLTMWADYLWVYGPLAVMMKMVHAEQVQPAAFRNYHLASMAVNSVMLSLCLIAACIACWPRSAAK